MAQEMLDKRSHEVLRAVAEAYLADGRPVGSRTLEKTQPWGISAATIRNVMADLEDMGYLEQPHTSAGRVPTDKGLRYYVDHFLSLEPPRGSRLSPEVYTELAKYAQDPKELLKHTTKLISSLSNQLGLIFIPNLRLLRLREVRFLPINRSSIMVMFISESGILQHRVIPRERGVTDEDLYRFTEEVNTRFAGKSLKEVFQGILKEMENQKAQYDRIYRNLLKMTGEALELWKRESESELYWEGMSNVLEQKEFWEDVERLRALFRAFEEKGRLAKILWRCIEKEDLQVVIGSEAEIEELKNISILAAPCCYGERPLGAIAVLGSRRMDYRNMVALIKETASLVNEILMKREGGFA